MTRFSSFQTWTLTLCIIPRKKISADGWVALNISSFWNISDWTLLNVNASITGLWDTEICWSLAHLAGSGPVKALDIPITRFHNYLPVTGELWKYLTNGQRLTLFNGHPLTVASSKQFCVSSGDPFFADKLLIFTWTMAFHQLVGLWENICLNLLKGTLGGLC